MKKFYDSKYLENTGRKAQEIKKYSYTFFDQNQTGEILDLGCGIGEDAYELSLISDKAVITGIDIRDDLLKVAKSKYVNQNLKFLYGDVRELPYDNNTVYGVRAERLFQHLTNQEVAVDEVVRVLIREGVFVVIETDWSSFKIYTGIEELDTKLVDFLSKDKIVNGSVVNTLPECLEKRGFNQVSRKVFPVLIEGLSSINELFKIEIILEEMLQKSKLTSEEYQYYLDRIISIDQTSNLIVTLNLMVISGVKN